MRLKLNIISGELIKEEYKLFDVSPGDVERFWFPYYPYGIIKGIKVIGTAGVMGFNVSVFTDETEKNPIYYSGSVNTILWDIMDIPVIDETGMERVYVVLKSENSPESIIGDFHMEIYTQRRL